MATPADDKSFDAKKYEQMQQQRDQKLAELNKPENDGYRYNEAIAKKQQEADTLKPGDPRRDGLLAEAERMRQKHEEAKQRAAKLESEIANHRNEIDGQRNRISDRAKREQLNDQDIKRQADVHLKSSGHAETPQTRKNAETIVRYGDDHRSMSQQEVQARFKAADMSKPVERTTVDSSQKLTQEIQVKTYSEADIKELEEERRIKGSSTQIKPLPKVGDVHPDRNWNDRPGQSFSTPGNAPQDLGIATPARQGPGSKGGDVRHHNEFGVKDGEKVDALKFTTAPIKDTWSDRTKRQDTGGGGQEYFIARDEHHKLQTSSYNKQFTDRQGKQNEVVQYSKLDGTRVAETRQDCKIGNANELNASRENRHDRARTNRRGKAIDGGESASIEKSAEKGGESIGDAKPDPKFRGRSR